MNFEQDHRALIRSVVFCSGNGANDTNGIMLKIFQQNIDIINAEICKIQEKKISDF